MKCLNCGYVLKKDAKFCGSCGVSTATMKCDNCGAEIPVYVKYCTKCGKPKEALEKTKEYENKTPYCLGTLIWLAFVCSALFFSFIFNIAFIGRGATPIIVFLNLVLLIMYVLLLFTKNRNFFYVIIGIVVMIFLVNIGTYHVNPFYAFLGLLNPFVTGILIFIPKKN